jgi:hypothetical protein
MANSAVQYKGISAILEGFDDAAISAWALLYNKQIIGKCAGLPVGESKEELAGLLKTLAKSNTTAQYTLCFYEDIKDKRKIRASTEPDLAKNVVIFDNEENPSPAYNSGRGFYSQVMDRLDIIDAKLAVKPPAEEDDDDEEDTMGAAGGWLGAINKILDNPRVQERIGDKFMQFIDTLMSPSPPQKNSMQKPAAMGSPGQTDVPQITQEQAEKIQASIEVLARIDPNLGDNLERIAQLAADNPKKYFNAIKMLNTFL